MEYISENIMEAIVVENIFGNLKLLKKEDYGLVGLEKDSKIIEEGWEVYATKIHNPRYFLFHPQKKIINFNFVRGDEVYDSLESTILKLKNNSSKSKQKTRGLGDVVEKFAKPIARKIDSIAGTNIEACGGCKKRREYLNKKFPNV